MPPDQHRPKGEISRSHPRQIRKPVCSGLVTCHYRASECRMSASTPSLTIFEVKRQSRIRGLRIVHHFMICSFLPSDILIFRILQSIFPSTTEKIRFNPIKKVYILTFKHGYNIDFEISHPHFPSFCAISRILFSARVT